MRLCSRYEGAGLNDNSRLQLFSNWQGSITTIMQGYESGDVVNIKEYACLKLVSGKPTALSIDLLRNIIR
jgi:hypothetical protein